MVSGLPRSSPQPPVGDRLGEGTSARSLHEIEPSLGDTIVDTATTGNQAVATMTALSGSRFGQPRCAAARCSRQSSDNGSRWTSRGGWCLRVFDSSTSTWM